MEALNVFLLIAIFIALWIGLKLGEFLKEREWKIKMPALEKMHREDATKRSRAVLGGHFTEQLAPYFPDFPFSPTECKFMGNPIDFIVFKGMDQKNITEVIFVEVKSGKSTLSTPERKLRDVLKQRKVSWQEYRQSS